MKITGIIAEYNPFHNGHHYHLKQARIKTNADYIIVVLSGNFVQRGAPALVNKYIRTEMALQNGADLVLELPCISACGSAEFFACGAVSLLNRLNSVNTLCFGSETPDLTKLQIAAQGMLLETREFKTLLRRELKKGLSYPKARSSAFLSTLPYKERTSYEAILKSPNNILSIEYLKALLRFHSPIIPYSIKRIDNQYHDHNLTHTGISSATALRSTLRDFDSNSIIQTERVFAKLFYQMPVSAYGILLSLLCKTGPLYEDDFSLMLHYALWNTKEYQHYADLTQEIENRILKLAKPSMTFRELAEQLKTKQYTRTRINRALLHLILQIRQEQQELWAQCNFSAYARILGFRKTSAPLLKELRKNSDLPFIQHPAKAHASLTEQALDFFQLDLRAHRLYETVFSQKYHVAYEEELQRKPLIIN